MRISPDALTNIFQFSRSLGYSPKWVSKNMSFREEIEGGNFIELLVMRQENRLIYTASWWPLDTFEDAIKECVFQYYLEKNMEVRDFLYYGIKEGSIWLRFDVFLQHDDEENLHTYLRVRARFVNTLDCMNQDLQNIIDLCINNQPKND